MFSFQSFRTCGPANKSLDHKFLTNHCYETVITYTCTILGSSFFINIRRNKWLMHDGLTALRADCYGICYIDIFRCYSRHELCLISQLNYNTHCHLIKVSSTVATYIFYILFFSSLISFFLFFFIFILLPICSCINFAR